MTLLFLHSASDTYGSGKILQILIQESIDRGHKAITILPEEGVLSDDLRSIGSRVLIKEIGILRQQYRTPLGLLNRLYFVLSGLLFLRKIIIAEKVDILYSNTTAIITGAVYQWIIGGVKHFWHVHEIIPEESIILKVFRFLMKKGADSVIMVSEAVYRYWNSNDLFTNNKGVVIHNGIPAFKAEKYDIKKDLGLTDDVVVIGMVARVHHWKGQTYFVKIASELRKRSSKKLFFVMVGDAFPGYEYLYEEINSEIEKQNIEESIIDLGFRSDIPELMNGFDVIIVPSTQPDPLPTVVLEAMSLGRVVVATKHGGASEMIDDGNSGYLIDLGEEKYAAAMIDKVLEDPSLRNKLEKEAKNRFQKLFSLERYRTEMAALLKL